MNRRLALSILATSLLIGGCGGNNSDGHPNAAQTNPPGGGGSSAPGGATGTGGSTPNGGNQSGGAGNGNRTGSGGSASGSGGHACQASNNPAHPWMNTCLPSADRASLLVKAMSLPQKIQQLSGNIDDTPFCAKGVRHVTGIPALEIPLFRITNGPVGIGGNDCSDKATALPSSIGLAASFDPAVAANAGTTMAIEAGNLGYQEIEGPGINLARNPQGGRNFEYLGEDPFLAGTMAVAEIDGIQRKNVIAMAKHFVANEQETQRMTIREVIDERVLRELYLLPFEMAVKDGKVASLMCSYNWVNGRSMCGNQPLLSGVLRQEWGFKGFVQSDFGANYTTVDTMKAGMDLTMNTPGQWSATKLQLALEAGTLSEKDLDVALTRRYTQMFTFGAFDHTLQTSPVDVNAGASVARQVGEQGAVLLKNSGAQSGTQPVLPINAKAVRSIALIGRSPLIDSAYAGGGSSKVNPLVKVPPAEGIRNTLAKIGANASVNQIVVTGTAPADFAAAVQAAKAADVAIVITGTTSSEGSDRASISPSYNQDELIREVGAANPRTIVVLNDNASAVVDSWINAAAAVLEVWFPGGESGNILGDLIFGLANPSGKLPVTFPAQNNAWPASAPNQFPGIQVNGNPTVVYSEGSNIGYRWYDQNNVKPAFHFGFGLSYTSFKVTDLGVSPGAANSRSPVVVHLSVENTGKIYGAEVAQIYLKMPGGTDEPPKRLVGFQKVWLNPGEKKSISVVVDPNASNHPFDIWDKASGKWKTPSGTYQVLVGTSSDDNDLVFAGAVNF